MTTTKPHTPARFTTRFNHEPLAACATPGHGKGAPHETEAEAAQGHVIVGALFGLVDSDGSTVLVDYGLCDAASAA